MTKGKLHRKCHVCRKKVLALSNKCRCNRYFCPKHKIDHPCTFDYKKHEMKRLKHNNPVIVKSKIKII